jgi:hypothetical protein
MPHAVTDFSPCGAAEVVSLAMDFSPRLATGEVLVTSSCVIEVYSGSDGSPQSHLLAGPTILGSKVGILFGAGVSGTVYRITIIVNTTGNQTLECYALLPITAQ